jgi:hypothetical protein
LVNIPDLTTDTEVREEIKGLELRTARHAKTKVVEVEEGAVDRREDEALAKRLAKSDVSSMPLQWISEKN